MVHSTEFSSPAQQEASAQLAFIESTMREGRKSTEYWGWCFVLWGISYFVATAWANLSTNKSSLWAWPVMMTASGIATALIARWRNKGMPLTTRSRAIGGIWIAVGFGITIFAFPLVAAGRFGDGHAFIAGIEILLGVAHIASGRVLSWKLQVLVGLLWWTAAQFSIFTHTDAGVLYPFLAATLICNIGFGAYLMYCEARDKAKMHTGQVSHA